MGRSNVSKRQKIGVSDLLLTPLVNAERPPRQQDPFRQALSWYDESSKQNAGRHDQLLHEGSTLRDSTSDGTYNASRETQHIASIEPNATVKIQGFESFMKIFHSWCAVAEILRHLRSSEIRVLIEFLRSVKVNVEKYYEYLVKVYHKPSKNVRASLSKKRSFKAYSGISPQDCEKVYNDDFKGRYCDECSEKIVLAETAIPTEVASSRVFLCENCQQHFIKLENISEEAIRRFHGDSTVLVQCGLLPASRKELPLCHCHYVRDWNGTVEQLEEARKTFLKEIRASFSSRCMTYFGYDFFHLYIKTILPPNSYLEKDDIRRRVKHGVSKSNRTSGVSISSGTRGNTWIWQCPIGSVHRSLAHLISPVFSTWLSAKSSLTEVVESEKRLMKYFQLANVVVTHKNFTTAVELIESYLLSRKHIILEKFENSYLIRLGQLLFRKSTGSPRLFLGTYTDRRKVDRLFRQCSSGKKPVREIGESPRAMGTERVGSYGTDLPDHRGREEIETHQKDLLSAHCEVDTHEEPTETVEETESLSDLTGLERLERAIAARLRASNHD